MLEKYPSLLVTKLFIPRLGNGQISRAHLLTTLERAVDRKLILIAAAAGFGKTSLIAEWCNQHLEHVCWFSLDEGDNDPARFLSYLIAAIQTRQPEIGQELLAALQSPQPPNSANVLPILLNQLAAISDKLILVLDDYHVIQNRDIHGLLLSLLDRLPPQLPLVLLTRTDPPLPLARLRANGQLLELRAANLRFSSEETKQLLNDQMRLSLTTDTIAALEARTEGWIVGLQLAAIALQNQPDHLDAFVQNFTGSHHFILDYLVEEVLARQPEEIRQFLLNTSILNRMNSALCTALMPELMTENKTGQTMLEHLERNNLFLVPLDQSRYWYRYHHLFADLLRARLQAENPTILPVLYQRAAQWHGANGLPEDAVQYALLAKDFEAAARLIVGPAKGVTNRGEVITLLDWYKSFPVNFIAEKADLCLYFGVAFALAGRWNEAETLLGYIEHHQADQIHSGAPSGEYLMLAYLVASFHQDTKRLTELIAAAQSDPNPDRVTKLVLGLLISLTGDLRMACQLINEVREASELVGDSSLALTAFFHECRFTVYLGDLHRAAELSKNALQKLQETGQMSLPMAVFAHVSLGRIYIEWNNLDAALSHLTQAIQLSERTGFVTGVVSSATMMLAEVKQAQGDFAGAIKTAREALHLAERYDPTPEVAWLTIYLARLWLTQGNIAAANDVLQQPTRQMQNGELPISLFYPDNILKVTQARLLLAQRKPSEAITILTQMSARPQNLLTVESVALLALARQAQGDTVHAGLMLEQALSLAKVENRLRAFLELGAPMSRLLASFCEAHPEHDYARSILHAFSNIVSSSPQFDALSEREIEILRLIAAGHSNDEIARTLILALSTVKWYINTMYGKLQVKTRSQAIARAHELDLLT